MFCHLGGPICLCSSLLLVVSCILALNITECNSLSETHSYNIISFIKAVNRVGLVTIHSFGPYLVDASPPIAGYVYDGDPGIKLASGKDKDFQTNTSTLQAFWEGFHDPHSSLIGYWWSIGTCASCDDVLPEQYVGLRISTYFLSTSETRRWRSPSSCFESS